MCAKKTTTTANDDNDDLMGLLNTLPQKQAKSKKPEYEVIPGFEKEVDEYLKLNAEKERIEAILVVKKEFFHEKGKEYCLKTKINDTVGFAGSGDDKVLFSPTCKYSGTQLTENGKETEIVTTIKKVVGDNYSRWFNTQVKIEIDTTDTDRLKKFIKYCTDGGYGNMFSIKSLLMATVAYHKEKYSSGLKFEIIQMIDGWLKPVDQIKTGKTKKTNQDDDKDKKKKK